MTTFCNLKFSDQIISAIGDEFNVVAIHQCRHNSLPEQTIVIQINKRNDMTNLAWQFLVLCLSSQHDVNEGEAESLDELMSSSVIAIRFCPFCGIKLQKVESSMLDESKPNA